MAQHNSKTIVLVCTSITGLSPGKEHHKLTHKQYDASHINQMKAQLDLVGAEYDTLIALTDQPREHIHSDITVIPLPEQPHYHYWWSKMYQFASELQLTGSVLYIDLDMMLGERFNELWHCHSDKHIVLRRAPRLDRISTDQFLPGISRPGSHNDHLAHIYNTSVMRYQPTQLTELHTAYCDTVNSSEGLSSWGDELFVCRWLLENDHISHTEFPRDLMPTYPSYFVSSHSVFGLMGGEWETVTDSSSHIDWSSVAAVTFAANCKPWSVAQHDVHIKQRLELFK